MRYDTIILYIMFCENPDKTRQKMMCALLCIYLFFFNSRAREESKNKILHTHTHSKPKQHHGHNDDDDDGDDEDDDDMINLSFNRFTDKFDKPLAILFGITS